MVLADPYKVKNTGLVPAPTIDGVIHSEEYAKMQHIDRLVDSLLATDAPEKSDIWIGHDEKFIYFAGILHDSQPKSILANEYRTNVSLQNDDQVAINIDLTNSLADRNYFGINPRGATSISLAGGRAAKREWSGEFIAKARITDEGWEFEARIPWQVMALPSAGPRDIRFNIERFISRLQRSYVVGFTANGKVAETPIWQQVRIPEGSKDKSLKLLPYFYGGYDKDKGILANGGLDVKTELGKGLQLVGTIEPDFRNIENQVLSLDFSRFERIAGEARPFFQEGSEFISSRIFTSQRVGKVDAGVKLYGKFNDKLTVGMLNANDFGDQNSFNATTQYQMNPNSNLRFGYANLRKQGLQNDAFFTRYVNRSGALQYGVNFSLSKDSDLGEGWSGIYFSNYNRGFWNFYFNLDRTTQPYRPRLAFAPETNRRGIATGFNYNRPFETGKVQFQYGGLYRENFQRTNGDAYRNNTGAYYGMDFRNSVGFTVGYDAGDFEGQRDKTMNFNVAYPNNNNFRNIGVSTIQGIIADKPYRQYDLRANYRTLGRMDLGLTHQIVRASGYQSQTIGTMNWDLRNNRNLAGRFVLANNQINPYLALSKSGNTGAEYTVVLGDPNAPRFRTALVFKVSVPFEVKY